MKNKLLITTALVATFGVSSAWAADYTGNVDIGDGSTIFYIEPNSNIQNATFALTSQGTSEADATRIGIVNGGNINISGINNFKDFVTFEGDTTFVAPEGAIMNVEGNLTSTKEAGVDLSQVDVNLDGYLIIDNGSTPFKIGNMTLADGSAIGGYEDDDSNGVSKLSIAEGKKLTFTGNNLISTVQGKGKSSVEITGAEGSSIDVNGTTKLKVNTKVDGATLNVNSGAALTADTAVLTVAENTELNLAGTLDTEVDGTGIINVTGAEALLKKDVNIGELSIQTDTVASKLIGTTATVGEIYVEKGNNLAIDVDDTKLTGIDKLTVYGNVDLSKDFGATTQVKVKDTGVLNIGSQKLTTAKLALWDGAETIFNVDAFANTEGSQAGGQIDGAVNVVNGTATITPVIASGALYEEDKDKEGKNKYVFTTGDVTLGTDAKLDVTKNALYDITLDETDNKTLYFYKKSNEEIATAIQGNANQTQALLAVTSSSTPTTNESFNTVQQNLNTLAQTNPTAATKELASLNPDEAPAVSGTAVSVATNTMSLVSGRMSGTIATPPVKNKNSGDSKLKEGVWAQGMYNKAKLDTANGFDSETTGFALGADHDFDNAIVGIGYSYGDTDIDTASRKTDAETHTVFAYGEYKPAKQWFLNGILSYGFGSYKEHKSVAGVPATGKYDVDTFGAQVMAGYEVNDWLVPEAGFRYFHVDQDAYTDSLGTTINAVSSDIFTGVLGAKVAKTFKADKSVNIIPEARLAVTYDFAEASNGATVGLANNTSYSVKGEKLDRLGFEVGAGVKVDTGAFELSARYEGKFREDYHDNTGLLEARYEF